MSYFNHFAKSKSAKIGDLLHRKKITNEFYLKLLFLTNKYYETKRNRQAVKK